MIGFVPPVDVCGPSIFDVCVCVGLWWFCGPAGLGELHLMVVHLASWTDFDAVFATALAWFLTEVAVLIASGRTLEICHR